MNADAQLVAALEALHRLQEGDEDARQPAVTGLLNVAHHLSEGGAPPHELIHAEDDGVFVDWSWDYESEL